MPERFPSKVRDPADNNDPHKIGRREPRAEYLGWLHCRQINEFVDHCAWMASQADSRVAYPGRDRLLRVKLGHSAMSARCPVAQKRDTAGRFMSTPELDAARRSRALSPAVSTARPARTGIAAGGDDAA